MAHVTVQASQQLNAGKLDDFTDHLEKPEVLLVGEIIQLRLV